MKNKSSNLLRFNLETKPIIRRVNDHFYDNKQNLNAAKHN